jgi:salicylate hydroxylase
MSAAIALRRAGHDVTVYERADFAGEVGASVSCAANGTRWLHEWDVDVAKGDPVVLKKLINRNWRTGEPVSVYDLDDYQERWGYVYNMFHRQHMHNMLKETALQEEGEGTPVRLLVNHRVRAICVFCLVVPLIIFRKAYLLLFSVKTLTCSPGSSFSKIEHLCSTT